MFNGDEQMKCGICQHQLIADTAKYDNVCNNCGRRYPDTIKNPLAYEQYLNGRSALYRKAEAACLKEAHYGTYAQWGLSAGSGARPWDEIEDEHMAHALVEWQKLRAIFSEQNNKGRPLSP